MLHDLLSLLSVPEVTSWLPKEPPSLSDVHEIELDVETEGLRWWSGDKPIGFSVALPGGYTQYLPFGHRGGGNLDEAAVRRWAERELRGKHITNLNTKFDVHMMRAWGIDLEAQGCTVSDVAHHAALLEDHRGDVWSDGKYHGFSLASLVEDFLEGEKKVTAEESGRPLDPRRMADYHAGVIAVRAEADVRQVQKLKHAMRPRLAAENLTKVLALEDRVIYVVCEMEKNGTLIDVDLLDRWMIEIDREIGALAMSISQLAGFQVDPGKKDHMVRVFEKFDLKLSFTETGSPSFTMDILKKFKLPIIQMILRWKRLVSLKSKSLTPYTKTVDRSTGLLRYALHQLRAQKDEHDEFAAGTVSGRFSSTKLITSDQDGGPDVGFNVQQVIKPAKQRVMMGFDEDDETHDDEIYVIRRLHVPAKGKLFVSSDAMQIEYRLFADYTRSPRLLDIYKEDPLASFHRKTHAMFRQYVPTLTYRRQKDVNFAYIYNAGLLKMGLMLDYIAAAEWKWLGKNNYRSRRSWEKLIGDISPGPGIRSLREMREDLMIVAEIKQIYEREIPEARPLIDRAMHLAMPECNDRCKKFDRLHRKYEHRGYVSTVLGRRGRFPDGKRIHKALNVIIQGSAADILKQKLVELHEERHTSGFLLRYTVHDEVDGDGEDLEAARRVATILNRQSFPQFVVPILWETGAGANWAQTENL